MKWYEAAPEAGSDSWYKEAQEEKPSSLTDSVKAFGSGVASSIPSLVKAGGAALSVPVTMGLKAANGYPVGSLKEEFGQAMNANVPVLDPYLKNVDYQPKTEAGRYSKAVGYGVGGAPLGGGAGLVRSAITGGIGGLTSEAGGDLAANTLGEDARIYGQIAGGFGGGLGADRYVKAGVNGAKNAAYNPTTAVQLKEQANQAYKKAEELGGTLKGEYVSKIIDNASKKFVPKNAQDVAFTKGSPVQEMIKKLEVYRDQPMSLKSAQIVDEALSEAIDGLTENGAVKKAANGLIDLQNQFRESVLMAGKGAVEGGEEGFKALKVGRKLWSQSRKLADIENIVEKAQYTQNPANSIKTGLKNIITNPKKRRGYSKAELDALKKAADSGTIGDLMNTFGSRLTPIIAGTTGGLDAGAAAAAASIAGRGAASRGAVNRVLNASEIIGSGMPAPTRLQKVGNGLVGAGAGIKNKAMEDLSALGVLAK